MEKEKRRENFVLERIWFRENLPPNISNLGCYIQFRETKPKKKKERKKKEREEN